MTRELYCLALAFSVAACAQTAAPPGGKALGIVEAAQVAIDINPQLGIQKQQVEVNRGALMTQAGMFDLALSGSQTGSRQYQPLPGPEAQAYGLDSITTDTWTTTAGASQLLRSGITVAPSVQLNRTADNYSQPEGVNIPQVSVQITLPLMRNRGRTAVTARETAAGLELNASVYDLNFLASQTLAGVAQAYWSYVGAVKSLDVYRESEARGREFLENLEALASADIYPRIQVEDAKANLANRTATRVGGEQSVVQAQQQLAIAMGLTAEQLTSVPDPRDPLPDDDPAHPLAADAEHLRAYIEMALRNRADYQAARKRVGEDQTLTVAARNQLKPQLDLAGTIGYTGVRTGGSPFSYLGPLFVTPTGPNASVTLQYQFPVGNHSARGQLAQSEATLRQQELRMLDLSRQIASSVVTAASALRLTVFQLEQTRQGSAAAQAGLEGERERLKQGVGSVLDTLQTEDRYISARLNEISAQVSYASAIAGFRLATGGYLLPDQPIQSTARDTFYSPITLSADKERP